LAFWEQTTPLIWEQSPHQSLETVLVDFEQNLFKKTFPEFEKKRFCVIFRNKNLPTKLRIFETKILNLLMDGGKQTQKDIGGFF
jgi:hypothetical protein